MPWSSWNTIIFPSIASKTRLVTNQFNSDMITEEDITMIGRRDAKIAFFCLVSEIDRGNVNYGRLTWYIVFISIYGINLLTYYRLWVVPVHQV